MAAVLNVFRSLDVFPKTADDAKEQTLSGAALSIITSLFIITLLVSEVSFFMSVIRTHTLEVDVSHGGSLQINFDIITLKLPCSVLSLDSMDVSGTHQLDVVQDIYKRRVDKDGNVYGEVLSGKVDSKSEERDAVKTLQAELGEGCNIYGTLQVSKVAGNFHISMHAQDFHVLSHVFSNRDQINVSHVINHLSFGQDYPGLTNPLDNEKKITDSKGSGMYEYYIKVVPTEYVDVEGIKLDTNQYSVTDHFRSTQDGFPAIYFMYDLSPIMVKVSEKKKPFLHFLVQLCAIVGGVFAVSGLVDKYIHFALSLYRKARSEGVLKA